MTRIALADLGRFELLLPAPGTAFRAEIDAAIRPAGVAAASPGRARRRPPPGLAHLRGLRAGRPPRHRRASASTARFRLVGIDDLPPRHVVLAQRTRGMPTAGARAVIQTLRHVLADSDRVPEGVRARAPGRHHPQRRLLRVAGMPNG